MRDLTREVHAVFRLRKSFILLNSLISLNNSPVLCVFSNSYFTSLPKQLRE